MAFTINIIANAMTRSDSLSGGDRIFIECARRWAERGNIINIFTTEDGLKVCQGQSLKNVNYFLLPSARFRVLGIFYSYIVRTIKACSKFFRISFEDSIVYSSSDFWPDSIPAFVMKKRSKNSEWVACFYLFAPSPFRSSSEIDYRGGRASLSLRNLAYYFSQQIAYWLIRRYADHIVVTNQLDKDIFVKSGVSPDRVIPVYGGVDIKAISKTPSPQDFNYDGCFVGRLHPQKGPLELIRIWHLVCKVRPGAKLVLIGNGPLEYKVKNEIKRRGLEGNVDVLGYIDGEQKYNILKSSKVFLHTPVLDTGGMAAAEGMACGLPVVGFDLPGYEFCYPRGMLKAPIGDLEAFADLVLNLLHDEDLYHQTREDALEFVQGWDWDKKAEEILEVLKLDR